MKKFTTAVMTALSIFMLGTGPVHAYSDINYWELEEPERIENGNIIYKIKADNYKGIGYQFSGRILFEYGLKAGPEPVNPIETEAKENYEGASIYTYQPEAIPFKLIGTLNNTDVTNIDNYKKTKVRLINHKCKQWRDGRVQFNIVTDNYQIENKQGKIVARNCHCPTTVEYLKLPINTKETFKLWDALYYVKLSNHFPVRDINLYKLQEYLEKQNMSKGTYNVNGKSISIDINAPIFRECDFTVNPLASKYAKAVVLRDGHKWYKLYKEGSNWISETCPANPYSMEELFKIYQKINRIKPTAEQIYAAELFNALFNFEAERKANTND